MTRSRKGNKANVERKAGDCWQWQATGQFSKGDSCGFRKACGDASKLPQPKERTSSPAPNSKSTQDGKRKSSEKKDENQLTRGVKLHVTGEI